MGRGREVAAHARWVDTAPRDCTSIRFGERVRAARRGGHIGSRRHWRPGWPLSLRLRLAAPAAPQTVAPDARSGSTQAALRRAQAEHSGSTQAAIMSNHEQSRALSRPTRSPHAVGVLGEGAAASSATDCLAIFPSCVPSRFVRANECLRWRRAVLGATAQRQQRAFARALRNRANSVRSPVRFETGGSRRRPRRRQRTERHSSTTFSTSVDCASTRRPHRWLRGTRTNPPSTFCPAPPCWAPPPRS